MSKLSIGIIGYGYWGPNLVRNFSMCPLTQVSAVLDPLADRRKAAEKSFPHVHTVASIDELLALKLDAVSIATPVGTHYSLAKQCLENGLHVLIEKPLTASVDEAQALIRIAETQNRILMVDHTYLFGAPVQKIKELIDNDELGELLYVDSIRINLGLFQQDVNVIWDLAPHDLSIADFILGQDPRSLSAWGCAHTASGIEDIAYVNMDYGDRLMANFHVNWMSPLKVRQMIFAGARKSLVFNELNVTEPIKIFDRGIEVDASSESTRQLRIGYRSGDVWSPFIEPKEALQGMATHFANCIINGETPLSDGRQGLRVVRYLEAATRSIKAQGGRIVLPAAHSTLGASHVGFPQRQLLANSA